MDTNKQNQDFTSRNYNRDFSNTNQVQEREGSAFDQVKSTVAEKLHAAARSLHDTAGRSIRPNELTGFGHQAAEWLDRSAEYVNQFEPARVRNDIEKEVRNNPGRSLLIAGAVGLVLGGLLRRR